MGNKTKPSDWAVMVAAQSWQQPETSNKEMDVDLAMAMAKGIDKHLEDLLSHESLREVYSQFAFRVGLAQDHQDAELFTRLVRQHFTVVRA